MGNSSPCHSCSNSQYKPKIKIQQVQLQYKLQPNLKPDRQNQVSPQCIQLYKTGHNLIHNYFITLIHVPTQMGFKTQFKWILQNKWSYPETIKNLESQLLKRRSFQQKVQWFHLQLQDLKVSWTKGCQNISVDRHNILTTSFQQLSKLNIAKQIKISFTDSKGQNDAGGIFREWLNLSMNQVFENQLGLFTLCQTTQTYYKLNVNQNSMAQCLNNASLLGFLIAKALMEKIPINCHLNHTIWRQILNQRIILDDIYSFDKDFYNNWKYILENPCNDLELNFTALIKDQITQKVQTFVMAKDGHNIKVTEQNKQDYLKKLIKLFCVKTVSNPIQKLKKSLCQIIPLQILSVFQPYELDCLLCGQQLIDVQDWQANTQYEGYQQNDLAVEWFWKVVRSLEQDMLRNLLHYCTGCSRVPVTGFKYLQSNRGQIKRFTIKKIPLNQFNPYPISYTCFNRLQLPQYSSQDQVSMRIYSISSQQINEINYDS